MSGGGLRVNYSFNVLSGQLQQLGCVFLFENMKHNLSIEAAGKCAIFLPFL